MIVQYVYLLHKINNKYRKEQCRFDMQAETRPSNTQEFVVLVVVVNDYTCKFSKLLLFYMYCTCVHVCTY